MKLTVALLTYNRPNYLKVAIGAIVNQTFTDFELLILDNGSTIETSNVIHSFEDPRIKYIRNEVNSREFGNYPFENSKGEYLIITHDDDIMEETFLQREVEVLDSNIEVGIVATCLSLIDKEGIIVKKNALKKRKDIVFKQYEFIKSYLYNGNFLACPTLMMRRSVINENKIKYNLEVGPMSDLYFSFNFNLLDHSIYLIKDPLYRYRIHDKQDGFLNRTKMEAQVIPHIKKMISFSEISNFALKYEQSALSQTLAFNIDKFFTRQISMSELINSIRELYARGLRFNRYSFYWAIRGVLRGLIKR